MQDGKPVAVPACPPWQDLRALQRRAALPPCCAAPQARHPARAPAADASSDAARVRDVAASAVVAGRPSQGLEPSELGGQQLGALRERHLAAPVERQVTAEAIGSRQARTWWKLGRRSSRSWAGLPNATRSSRRQRGHRVAARRREARIQLPLRARCSHRPTTLDASSAPRGSSAAAWAAMGRAALARGRRPWPARPRRSSRHIATRRAGGS